MNLGGGRRSADEGDDDYWPFDQGASPADAPGAAPPPPSPPPLPPRQPAAESVLPQGERRAPGDRRQVTRRRSSRRWVGGDAAGERRSSPGRRRSDPQEPVRAVRAVRRRPCVRGALRSPHVADVGLLLLAALVAVLVVLALTG